MCKAQCLARSKHPMSINCLNSRRAGGTLPAEAAIAAMSIPYTPLCLTAAAAWRLESCHSLWPVGYQPWGWGSLADRGR